MPIPKVARIGSLIIVATFAALTSTFALAADDPAASPESPEAVARLVRDLGAPSFEIREAAGRKLLSIGLPALLPLRAAAAQPDLETARRARKLLDDVERLEQERRLQVFLKEPAAAPDDLLPGLKRFRETVGRDASLAALFAEIQRAEPALARAAASSDGSLETALSVRCSELFVEYNVLQSRARTAERITAILFWQSDAAVKEDDQTAQMISQFVYWNEFQSTLAGAPSRRQVLGRWIAKENAGAAYQKVHLGMAMNIPECVQPAIAVCKARPPGGMAQFAVLALARFGAEEHLPVLETMLTDETVVSRNAVNNRTTYESRMQDVALAALVQITKQNHDAYGFRNLQKNAQTLFQTNTIGFASNDERAKSLQKWRAWRFERLEPAEAELPAARRD